MNKHRFWSVEDKIMIDENSKEECIYLSELTWGDWVQKHYYELLNDKADWVAMPYIGKKDRNNKEICSGDIVTFNRVVNVDGDIKRQIGFIEFKGFSYVVRYGEYDFHGLWDFSLDVEVIGNVHENPELLQVI